MPLGRFPRGRGEFTGERPLRKQLDPGADKPTVRGPSVEGECRTRQAPQPVRVFVIPLPSLPRRFDCVPENSRAQASGIFDPDALEKRFCRLRIDAS
jgi:hypothetical protein